MNKIEWNDKYKTKLCIYHHLRECTRKYEKYVDVEADTEIEKAKADVFSLNGKEAKEQAEYELNKELIDLYLLIESLIEQSELERLEELRVERFAEKRQANK